MARKYRSIPTEVEAIRYTGDNLEELIEFTRNQFREVDEEDRTDDTDVIAEVFDTLHRTWVGVKHGQWIIKGTLNEFYPCAPAVFDTKYEEVK